MTLFNSILLGFLIKFAASFDDTLTRIPILATLTKTRGGKAAFSIGTFLALTLIIIFSVSLGSFLEAVPYVKQGIALLIFFLALAVYSDFFTSKENEEVKRVIVSRIPSNGRLIQLIMIGFVISLITLIDDMLVLLPLFLGQGAEVTYRILGVYLALFVQILAVIYFSQYIEKFKYRKETATVALILLAILIGFNVI